MLEFVHVNELHGDAATGAHLLEFDSVHGRWPSDRSAPATAHRRRRDASAASARGEPGDVAWGDARRRRRARVLRRFRDAGRSRPYFERGVRKVIVAAPVKDAGALNVVVGVNDDRYDPAIHDIVTAASCTTNCLAPVVKVLHEGIGIRHGSITTLHDLTNTQTIVDAPHKDLRRARAASHVADPDDDRVGDGDRADLPRAPGPARRPRRARPAAERLADRLRLRGRRARRPSTRSTACCATAADGPLAGILGYEERPLVSVDYKNDPRSAIVDAPSTMVVDGTQVKVYAWYDNEWGYANRLVELAAIVGRVPEPD